MFTLDEMITRLKHIKNLSHLHGNTMVYICLPHTEYKEVTDVSLDVDEYGAIALIKVSSHE